MSGLILPRRFMGANHVPAPASIPFLSQRARLDRMVPAAETNWQGKITLGDDLGNAGPTGVGNCVPCAQLRAEQVMLNVAMGSSYTPTKAEAIALYSLLTGYVPGNPATDIGTDTDKAMQRWCSQGYLVNSQLLDVPAVWVQIDPANLDHQKIAIDSLLFVLLTLQLTQADIEADSWANLTLGPIVGRHRVMCAKHDQGGLWLVTWGQEMFAAPAWLAQRVIACDAVVSRRMIETTGFSPANLNLDDLEAEAAQLRAA